MSETQITCPHCKVAFPLTESLAAPLVEASRREFEQKLAQKETDVVKREAAVTKEREALAEKLAEQLKIERERISAEESRKARLSIGNDLDQKTKELTEIQAILKVKESKLAEAQVKIRVGT